MFHGIRGNDEIKQSLQRLVINGRLPHSMLFAGVEGIGKLRFARELAKSFTCTDLINSLPCGACAGCRRVDTFDLPSPDKKEEYEKVIFTGHLDVGLVVPYKRTILVEAVRGLEREAFFRPFEGRARVFIVNDADKMNAAGANALLKTLEEPAESTYVFLISSRVDSLLATIRSRCQTIQFAPASAREVESVLIETNKLSREDAALAARMSTGSFGKALSFDPAEYRDRRERMLAVVAALADGDRATLISISDAMNAAANKDRYEEDLGILESLLHDVWILAIGSDDSQIANIDLADRLRSFTAEITKARASACLSEIECLRQQFIVNVNRKVATDALFLAMAA